MLKKKYENRKRNKEPQNKSSVLELVRLGQYVHHPLQELVPHVGQLVLGLQVRLVVGLLEVAGDARHQRALFVHVADVGLDRLVEAVGVAVVERGREDQLGRLQLQLGLEDRVHAESVTFIKGSIVILPIIVLSYTIDNC